MGARRLLNSLSHRFKSTALGAGALGLGVLGVAAVATSPFTSRLLVQPARAQATPSLMEFRWDNTKDYRKLYYFMTNTRPLARSEYYFILKPKDRKTAILKLSITVPKYFDAKLDPKEMKLCKMSEGGMLSRTRCEKDIPATIELADNGNAIEVYPNVPVSDEGTIGVYMMIFNPFNNGMYQFNALAQAPGDIPIAGYLGSWLIQIEPPSN